MSSVNPVVLADAASSLVVLANLVGAAYLFGLGYAPQALYLAVLAAFSGFFLHSAPRPVAWIASGVALLALDFAIALAIST